MALWTGDGMSRECRLCGVAPHNVDIPLGKFRMTIGSSSLSNSLMQYYLLMI
jgi:hypothetical protein